MDVRNSLITKKFTISNEAGDEIQIGERYYGVTKKLLNILKLKDVIVYLEVILIAVFSKELSEKGYTTGFTILDVAIFFFISMVVAHFTSRLIISERLVKKEVTPINPMYRN